MTWGELTIAQLDALAMGRPGPAELAVLEAAQEAKRRLLLLALRRGIAGPLLSDVECAFDLLDRADAADPHAVTGILGRPLINAWLARCIWGFKHLGPGGREVAVDVRFLSAVAAAAAVRAGLDFEIQVWAAGGDVFLPGVGGVVGLGDERPVVRSAGAGVEIVGAGLKVVQGGDGWRSPHAVSVVGSPPWRLEVEDQDPYRDCFGYRPADYLPQAALTGFSELLAQAWRLIERDHPEHAAVMRASLRAVVPLAAPASSEGVALSASSQLAYGSVAVLVPGDAAMLANLLIHEVQHMTLSGVLDIVKLYADGGQARHHAPWRLDPRPIGPLLQGTFAHLGVTDFWRAQRRRESGAARAKAEFEFASWRELTTRAIRVLADSGELTGLGERFVAGMASTMDGWWQESVPPEIGAAARDLADTDAVRWRLHNQRADASTVGSLADAFVAGRPAGAVASPEIIEHQAIPARKGSQATGSTREYRDRIAADTRDDDAWVGLAMTLSRDGTEPAATVLALRPELVRALCEWTRPTGATIEELAVWLSTGVTGDHGDGGSV